MHCCLLLQSRHPETLQLLGPFKLHRRRLNRYILVLTRLPPFRNDVSEDAWISLHILLELVQSLEVSFMQNPIRWPGHTSGKVGIPSCRVPRRFDQELRHLRRQLVALLCRLRRLLGLVWVHRNSCCTTHGSIDTRAVLRNASVGAFCCCFEPQTHAKQISLRMQSQIPRPVLCTSAAGRGRMPTNTT